jgi:hypothetical protein
MDARASSFDQQGGRRMNQAISQKDARLMLYCLQELVSIIGPLKSDTLCKIPDGLVNAYLDAKKLAERLDRTGGQ